MKNYISKMGAKEKCPPRQPAKIIFWSWFSSFIGISILCVIEKFIPLLNAENIILVGSFGASAVLVYGAPLAEFSQPRNLIGGHLVSAFIGVTIHLVLGSTPILACSLAVSLAILFMHLTRTMHPPGGATALIAVIGGEQIHALHYRYVFCPILCGAFILLVVGLLVNNLSRNSKRHYPLYWY